MYPVDFPKRLEQAKGRTKDVNCIGATFFLMGIDQTERPLETFDNDLISNNFSVAGRSGMYLPDTAVAFGVWILKYPTYIHMGIINPHNRSRIIHREQYNAPISEISIDELTQSYSDRRFFIDFLKLNERLRN